MKERNRSEFHPHSKSPLIMVVILLFLFPAFLFYLTFLFDLTQPHIFYLLTIFSAVLLGMVGLWAIRKEGFSFREIGISVNGAKQALLLVFLFWVIMGFTLFILFGSGVFKSFVAPALLFQQWLFVGMAEEILVRGYILKCLARAFQKWGSPRNWVLAISISSALFALYHIPARLFQGFSPDQIFSGMGGLFAAGIFFSYVFIRTRNIIFTGLVHGGWNAPLLGTQGDFLQIIVLVIFIESYCFIKKKRKGKPQNP